MRNLILLPILLIALSIQAQSIEGDTLMAIIGSKTDAPSVQSFLSSYEVKNLTDAKYSSAKSGIDMTAKNDTFTEMTLYRSSTIYGAFSGRLPRGLAFQMPAADIAKKLGKPTTSYMNSGYCEYNFGKYILTCSFENKALDRVTISLK